MIPRRTVAWLYGWLAGCLMLGCAVPAAAAPAAARDLNVQTDCGAQGNGAGDDTGKIQACIDQAAHSGRAVYIPTGVYRISGPLRIANNDTTVYGTAATTTLIVQTNGDARIFDISNNGNPIDGIRLRGLGLVYSTPRPAGFAIFCDTCWRTYFQQLNIGRAASNLHLGTGIWVTGGNQVFVEDTVITNDTAQGMYFAGVGDVFLSNVEINQLPDDTQSTGIVFDSGVGGIYAINVNVTAGETAFLFENTRRTVPPNFGFFTNCLADTVNGVGWHFQSATSMRLTNSWAATAANYGIIAGGDVDGLSIMDSRIYNNGSSGVVLNAGTRNVSIKGSTITGNSRLAAHTKPGIEIGAGVSAFQILDNVIGSADRFGNTQSYAITIAPGASDHYMIVGNDLHDNAAGGLLDQAKSDHAVTANNL